MFNPVTSDTRLAPHYTLDYPVPECLPTSFHIIYLKTVDHIKN